MVDREKVIIDRFDSEKDLVWTDDDQFSMGYNNGLEVGKNIALELLKEQEPVKPIAQTDDTFECSCGAIVGWDELDASGIVQTHFNYCPFCGRAVKWE